MVSAVVASVVALFVLNGDPPTGTGSACESSMDQDCILIVYRGEVRDSVAVDEIRSPFIVWPDGEGRYHVARGEQLTVITSARLPGGYGQLAWGRRMGDARALTQLEPLSESVDAVYTFAVPMDERGESMFSIELVALRQMAHLNSSLEDARTILSAEFLVTSVRLNRYDRNGAASDPGSYSFLRNPTDPGSAIWYHGDIRSEATALRINAVDASGIARSRVYRLVKPGDKVDYQLMGPDCGWRFVVNSVTAEEHTFLFGIEYTASYGSYCGDYPSSRGFPFDVHFDWKARDGSPRSDGLRVLLVDEPTHAGTYLISNQWPLVIDVPQGMSIVFLGTNRLSSYSELPDRGKYEMLFKSVETDSLLGVNPESGRESRRIIRSQEDSELFDRIIMSIRFLEYVLE